MNSMQIEEMVACHECDLLVKKRPVAYGEKGCCPRCGNKLYEPKKDSVSRCMAMAMSGLILIIPANFLPLVTMELLGRTEEDTLISGVLALYREDYWFVALIVFMAGSFVPFLKLLLMLFVTICLKMNLRPRSLPWLFRFYHEVDTWGMLEVYLLAILIAAVKLLDLAEILPGVGLYCFVGLLLTTILLSVNLDEAQFWKMIEDDKNG
ncbi:MAG: paraquat-inducible protein A [Gammaproteobacteria bacterium]|nr:MAG: paraquat-inducible protein A [Gammaproteobacteria bacterium]